MEFLVLLVIAFICGALGQTLSGYSRGGCLATIAVGFVGSLLGTWLARTTGLPEIFVVNLGGRNFPVIWSIVGGALFTAVLGFLTRRQAPN
jgi:uncharacterized membrane protein YeaQ/YmgE (transglycosylase-associated protein family)